MRVAAIALLMTAVATAAAAQGNTGLRGEAAPFQCTGEMDGCVAACTARYNTCVGSRDGFVCRPQLDRCLTACRARFCSAGGAPVTAPGTR
jgi:hypothetical protein